MLRSAQRLLKLALALSFACQGSAARIKQRRALPSEAARKTHGVPQVTWTEFIGAAPPGRLPAASATCEGRLYVFGGETDLRDPDDPWTVNAYLGDLWVFTPSSSGRTAAGNWTQLSEDGDGPPARVTSSMVCASGVLTLFGGLERTGPWEHVSLGDVWEFHLGQRKWRLVQADSAAVGGPGPRVAHTATLTDLNQDAIVVIGGSGADNSNVWVYSLSAQTWTQRSQPSSPAPRHFHTAVAVPGTASLRIWGGIEDESVWEYDLRSNTWSYAGAAPAYASGRMGAHFGGRLWSFGGFILNESGMRYTNDLLYQSEDGQDFDAVVSVVGEAPEARTFAAVVVLDGALWVYGGYRRPDVPERLTSLWRAELL